MRNLVKVERREKIDGFTLTQRFTLLHTASHCTAYTHLSCLALHLPSLYLPLNTTFN